MSLPLLQHYLATSVFRGMVVFKFSGGRSLPIRKFGVLQSYFRQKFASNLEVLIWNWTESNEAQPLIA
jgi:hypothetical protein